jgi:glycosyltransferase involved in cell wall biosynthesis
MKLALFFTCGTSLEQWLDKGLFDREKLIYEELLQRKILSEVLWFTYGCKDKAIAERLKDLHRLHKDIEVIQMPAVFKFPGGSLFYSLFMPLIMKKNLKDADILKTNQMSGSWSGVLTKKITKKPLIVRTGYTWSRLKDTQKISILKNMFIKKAEVSAYNNADFAVVSTQSQAEFIKDKYSIEERKVFVIPNYIDINLFKPDYSAQRYTDRLVYVGRISKEKNLFNLVDALGKAKMQLDIYGSGDNQAELEKYARQAGVDVSFKGIVANNLLPNILSRYNFFVLSSFHESLPKSLLEAMACGLICIGTNVTGINEVIIDGVNGWLAKDTNPDSIFQAVQKAKKDSNSAICRSAVETIRNNFSLEVITQKYSEMLENIKNAS